MPQENFYDPEIFLESTTRTIKEYVETNINTRIYQVIMEFPGAQLDAGQLPMSKTLIHFELDDDDNKPVGFGDGMFQDNYQVGVGIFPQYAARHMFTFDVGIWASDKSGGTTSRMRAKQLLNFLFDMNNGGAKRMGDFSDNGDGRIEVLSFSGGRFVLDSANDVRLYRMVDCQLGVRVFSRTPAPTVAEPAIETITQAPNLTIIG
jgi:hypothetical protein